MNTWDGGKQDDADIAAAEWILRHRFGKGADIRREPFLVIPRDGASPPRIAESLPLVAAAENEVWHPDLALVGPPGDRPLLIVEIDGAYHDSGRGRKATGRRDRAYRANDISFIAIRKSEYPGGDFAWQDALEAMIARPRPPCTCGECIQCVEAMAAAAAAAAGAPAPKD